MAKQKFFPTLALTLVLLAQSFISSSLLPASAAENLRLREGLSYEHDLDKGFPIIADKFDDLKIESGKGQLIFFGAAGDLNTNRQAKRVVDLYKKYKDGTVKFIIVDVDHASSPEAKQLIKNYYQGYIPQEVILDKQGKTFWTHIGEVDLAALATQVEKSLQ
ncbi:MAG: hypothetical protein K2X81_06090 [Candidatus Obscuribacterales bacterium]|nr:hypothetical protein [Candidatus Obscuribacterales bacterium]